MTTTIYLVRHGNSVGNIQKRIIGITDIALTKEGFNQGKQVAKFFKNKKLDAVYSSSRSRATITAMFTAKQKKLPLHIDDRFAEFNFGKVFEGKTWAEALLFKEDAYRQYREEKTFPTVQFPQGGECSEQVVKRFLDGIYSLAKKHEGKSIMITTHSVALMLFLSYHKNGYRMQGLKRERRLPNASITTLKVENEKITIIEEGYTKHLKGITV